MYKLKEIADKVYYVGVNDRQKAPLREYVAVAIRRFL